jgi:hypothetical protein
MVYLFVYECQKKQMLFGAAADTAATITTLGTTVMQRASPCYNMDLVVHNKIIQSPALSQCLALNELLAESIGHLAGLMLVEHQYLH